MSVKATTWAFELQHIPQGPKLVLLALADEANAVGENAFPSQERIARHTCLSVRSVSRHLLWLEEHSFVSREKRFRVDGARTSDLYKLHMDADRPPDSLAGGQRYDHRTKNGPPPDSGGSDHRTTVSDTNKPVSRPVSKPVSSNSARAREALATVLDKERVEAVIEHRKAKRSPLTAYAAGLLAKHLAQCRDPHEAADVMIESGWLSVKPDWLENRSRNGRNGKSRTEVAGEELLEEIRNGKFGLGLCDEGRPHATAQLPKPSARSQNLLAPTGDSANRQTNKPNR